MDFEMLAMDMGIYSRRQQGILRFDLLQDYYQFDTYSMYAVFENQEAMDKFTNSYYYQ